MPGMAVATTSSTPVDTRRFGDTPQAVVLQILHERVVRRDHTPSDVTAAAGRLVEHCLVVIAGHLPPEQHRQTACVIKLDHENLETDVRGHPAERGSDSRLPHATLAGDDHDLALPAERLAIHSRRHYRPLLAPSLPANVHKSPL